jgi:hypothetical protein
VPQAVKLKAEMSLIRATGTPSDGHQLVRACPRITGQINCTRHVRVYKYYTGTLLLDVERYANHFSMQQKETPMKQDWIQGT